MIVERLVVEIMMRLTIRLMIERRDFRRIIRGDHDGGEHCRFTGKETVSGFTTSRRIRKLALFCSHLSRSSIARGPKRFLQRKRESFKAEWKLSEV